MKKIQNQPALAIVVLGLLLGLSIGKIYQQNLDIKQIKKATALEFFTSENEEIAPMVDQLSAHESKLEAETARIKEEMARLQVELEAVRRAHEKLLDQHLRQLGRAQ
jgi:DNA-binding transcriptional MerR regulator